MSETAQNENNNGNAGFTTVQAYTLAVITLAIGIAVATSPADRPACHRPRVTMCKLRRPVPWQRSHGAAQLPGIGSTQQQQAPSAEMVAKAAEPLLAQLKNQSQRSRDAGKTGQPVLRQPGLSAGNRGLRKGPQPSTYQRRRAHRSGNGILVHRHADKSDCQL